MKTTVGNTLKLTVILVLSLLFALAGTSREACDQSESDIHVECSI